MDSTTSGQDSGEHGSRSTVLVRERPDVFHLTCCHDDDLALCGLDVSDMPFTEGDGEQNCTVCHDLGDGDFCPRALTCPDGSGGSDA